MIFFSVNIVSLVCATLVEAAVILIWVNSLNESLERKTVKRLSVS